MLVQSQKPGDSIFITIPAGTVIEEDTEIEIRTNETSKSRAKLGINAPREFGISRSGPYRGGVPIPAPEPEPDPVPALT